MSQPCRRRAWWWPPIGDAVFLCCLLVAIRFGGVMLSADGDAARHLTLGELILATGSVPTQDLFTHTTPGQLFLPHEWLAEVLSATSYRLAGEAGPVLLHGGAIGLAFATLFRQLRSRGEPLLLATATTLLAAFASSGHWLARPHVFTLVGTAAFAATLDGWHAGRLRRRWLWALAPAMAVWVNLHGGFLIGLVLIGAYGAADVLRWLAGGERSKEARRRLRWLAGPAVGAVGATILSPAGPQLWLHLPDYLGSSYLRDATREYMSPNFHEGSARYFLLMLLALVAGAAWSRRRPALHEGLLAVGFTYLALYSARNIPLFAVVVAPVLAAQLSGLAPVEVASGRLGRLTGRVQWWVARRNTLYGELDARGAGWVWPAAAMVGLLVTAMAQLGSGEAPLGLGFDGRLQPVGAAAYLRTNPPAGNGFNLQSWGGYLLHELWPVQQVFLDGEMTVNNEWVVREYQRVVELHPGWEEVLDQHQITWVIYPTGTPLVDRLTASPQWRVTFQDRVSTVFRRADAEGR